MAMRAGQTYRYENIRCRGETQVIEVLAVAQHNPRCGYGTEMKKPYATPVLRDLPLEVKVLAGPRTDAGEQKKKV